MASTLAPVDVAKEGRPGATRASHPLRAPAPGGVRAGGAIGGAVVDSGAESVPGLELAPAIGGEDQDGLVIGFAAPLREFTGPAQRPRAGDAALDDRRRSAPADDRAATSLPKRVPVLPTRP